jgi:hypothetical protein
MSICLKSEDTLVNQMVGLQATEDRWKLIHILSCGKWYVFHRSFGLTWKPFIGQI